MTYDSVLYLGDDEDVNTESVVVNRVVHQTSFEHDDTDVGDDGNERHCKRGTNSLSETSMV